MTKIALGRKVDKYAEKKKKKNEMVLDLAMDSPSKMFGNINHLAMGVRGCGVALKG